MSITLSLQPSPTLSGVLALSHAGAVACLSLSAAPWWLKVAGLLACLFSAWHTIRKYALLSHPEAIVQCTLLEEDQWHLRDYQGREYTACLLGDSWRSRYVVILNFQLKEVSHRRAVMLLKGMLEATVLRRLQVYLTVSPRRKKP